MDRLPKPGGSTHTNGSRFSFSRYSPSPCHPSHSTSHAFRPFRFLFKLIGLKTELVARILLRWPRTKLRRWWRAGDLLVPVRDDCLAMSADEGLKGRRRNRRTPWLHFGAVNLIQQAVKVRFGFSRLPGVRILRVFRSLE